MARSDDLTWLYPETLVIGTSIVAQILPLPGQAAAILKWGSGGSLQVQGQTLAFGASNGTQSTAEQLATGSTYASAQVYLVGTSEILNLNMQGILTLSAIGSTVTCYLLRGLTD